MPVARPQATVTINKPVRITALAVIPVLLAGLAGVKLADSRASQSTSPVRVFIPDQPPVYVVDQAPADDPNTAEPEYSGGDILLFRDPVLDPDTGRRSARPSPGYRSWRT